jgi:hypothetical protein
MPWVDNGRGQWVWSADDSDFSAAPPPKPAYAPPSSGGGGASRGNAAAPPAFTTFVPGSAATQPRTPEQEAAYQEMVKSGPASPTGVGATFASGMNANSNLYQQAVGQNANTARLSVNTAMQNLRDTANGVAGNRSADATRNDTIAGNYDQRQAPQADTAQADLARQQQQDTLARLRAFQTRSSGLEALRQFAQAPTGPSAAEAQLRMQAARDRRAAMSLARSARGGPTAVAQAMQVAQGEQSATSAETRGQASILRATEDAQRRQESLSALQAIASGEAQADQTRLGALTQEGNLITGTRGQDIDVMRQNLDARLQTMGLNDNQVRFFSGLADTARQDAAKAVLDAQNKGVDTALAVEQIQMQYTAMAWNMLTDSQRLILEEYGIRMGVKMNDAQQRSSFLASVMGFAGMGLTAAATAFGGPAAGAGAAVGTQAATQAVTS